MTKDEILRLPELTREEQCARLHEWGYNVKCGEVLCKFCYGRTSGERYDIARRPSFWDLAGRLRDEVVGAVVHWPERFCFEMALREVQAKINPNSEFLIWLCCEAQSIHWISAALLAKLEAEK